MRLAASRVGGGQQGCWLLDFLKTWLGKSKATVASRAASAPSLLIPFYLPLSHLLQRFVQILPGLFYRDGAQDGIRSHRSDVHTRSTALSTKRATCSIHEHPPPDKHQISVHRFAINLIRHGCDNEATRLPSFCGVSNIPPSAGSPVQSAHVGVFARSLHSERVLGAGNAP